VWDGDDDDDDIPRLDSAPPSSDAADPYTAPTRVGPMDPVLVDEMVQAAQARASVLGLRHAERVVPQRAAPPAPPMSEPVPLPRLYQPEEPEDMDDAATTQQKQAQQNAAQAVVPFASPNRTVPIAHAVVAAVVASVDARKAAMPERILQALPHPVRPPPAALPALAPAAPPGLQISTLQLVCGAIVGVTVFVVGLVMFLRSRGLL
jgi:hypothetical protein